MLVAEECPAHRQSPAVEALSLVKIALHREQQSQIIDTCRHIRMFGAVYLLPDCQRFAKQWLGLGVLAPILEGRSKIVEAGRYVRMIAA